METEDADKLESRVLLVEGDGTFGKSLVFFFFFFVAFAVCSTDKRNTQVSQSKIRAKLNRMLYGYVMRK